MSVDKTHITASTLLRLLSVIATTCALAAQALAQTPGGTAIQNQASATYSDGTNSYNTVSNTVTITVSNVSGVAITPDAGALPSVVAGQTGVLYSFKVTNTGNFIDQVRFLSNGASMTINGPGVITRAVIDVNNNGLIDAGDTNIFTNAADVISANIAQNAFINVLVEVTINAGATAGQNIQVFLGDASTGGPTFDNQPAATSPHEVRTVTAGSVNGLRAARGDVTATVASDAALSVTLTAPAGPVALGSNITLTYGLSNIGSRTAQAQTFANAPGGSNTGVFLVATVPVGTIVGPGNVFPAGTLFSISPTAQDPITTATWTTAQPPLNQITRVAYNEGATLNAGASGPGQSLIVTVLATDNASVPISERADGYAKNSVGANITAFATATTTLQKAGAVLIGPNGAPGAVGPTDNNDDYTNKSVNTGIANVAPGGTTTAPGVTVFTNTVQNSGNTDDTITLTAPTVPAGFTVEISTNGGTSYTTVSGGGNTSLAVPFGSSANILVRITAPAGQTVLTGFDTVIQATSTVTPAAFNKTIDRLYTGFVRLDKSATVSNATGVGNPTDPVPGAVITYNVLYKNISAANGGAGCVNLTASNVVVTEDGLAAPNNWGTFTTANGAPSDSGSGVTTTVSATKYTDAIASLPAGASGTFSFKRTIN